MTGKTIRDFFTQLFGSRLTARLEEDLLRLRSDMDQRLQDKDKVIAGQSEDIQRLQSKITTYELTIMPHASRMGAEVVAYQKPSKPNFEFLDIGRTKSRWEQVQEDWEKQLKKDEEELKNKSAAQSA